MDEREAPQERRKLLLVQSDRALRRELETIFAKKSALGWDFAENTG